MILLVYLFISLLWSEGKLSEGKNINYLVDHCMHLLFHMYQALNNYLLAEEELSLAGFATLAGYKPGAASVKLSVKKPTREVISEKWRGTDSQ